MKKKRVPFHRSISFKLLILGLLLLFSCILSLGYIFYKTSSSGINDSNMLDVLGSLAALFFVSAMLFLQFHNSVIFPIKKLRRDTEIISLVNFSHKVSVATADEIGEIGRRVEELAQKASKSFKKVDSILEHKVKSISNEINSLSTVLGSIGAGIIVINRDGLIILANKQATTEFSSLRSMIGHSIFNYIDQTILNRAISNSFSTGAHSMEDLTDKQMILSPFVNNGVHDGYVVTLWPKAEKNLVQPRSRGGRPEFYDFDLFSIKPSTEKLDLDIPFKEASIVSFDTETTGLSPSSGDKIISIGAVRIRQNKIRRSEFFESLVNPGKKIPPSSIKFHNITDEMVADEPALDTVMPQFLEFIDNNLILGHNIAFDLKFMNIHLKSKNQPELNLPVLDTLLLSYLINDHAESHNLKDIGERLGVKVIGLHTALGDAITTAEVFLKMIPMLEDRKIKTVAEAIDFSKRAIPIIKEQSGF